MSAMPWAPRGAQRWGEPAPAAGMVQACGKTGCLRSVACWDKSGQPPDTARGVPPESSACQVPPSISFPGSKRGNTLRAVQRRSRGVRSLCQAWRVRPWCPGLAALESGRPPEQDGPLVGPRPHPPSSSPRDPGCPPSPSQCPPLTECSPRWSTVAATAHPGWGWAPIPAPFRGNLEKAFKCRLILSTHACALLSATSGLWGGGAQEDPPPRTAPSLCPCRSSIP